MSSAYSLQLKKLQAALIALALMGLLLTACEQKSSQPFISLEPSISSPLALSSDGKTLWVVNPDANTVAELNTHTLELRSVTPVGKEPWAIAVTPKGLLVVMNRASGSLSLLDAGKRSDLWVGSELGGLALSPTGRLAFVSVSSSHELVVVNLETKTVSKRIALGQFPWSIAVTNDGDADDLDETIVVSHRIARLSSQGEEAKNDGKEGWLSFINASDYSVRERSLPAYTFGFANILEGLAVQGNDVWVSHLLNSPELPRDFETTVSAALTNVSLDSSLVPQALHLNDESFSTPVNFPRAVTVTRDKQRAYLVLAGTDGVMGVDLSGSAPKLIGFWRAGKNPRGIVLSPDETQAYVMNYLSRDMSLLDLSNESTRAELVRVNTSEETLEPEVLQGKVLFNNASDPRLSHLGWISCASCHPDGGADNTTWVTPEGHRNTSPLWNLESTAPYHASASRDELEDFEHDIETLMGGIGLAPGEVQPLLQHTNARASGDLTALAAYLKKGVRVPQSSVNAAEAQGENLFKQLCANCHSGEDYTSSNLAGEVGTLAPRVDCKDLCSIRESLVNVNTFNAQTDVLGKEGFDIPTLRGLHATAPYLHNGHADTLYALLDTHSPQPLSGTETEKLVYFLLSLD